MLVTMRKKKEKKGAGLTVNLISESAKVFRNPGFDQNTVGDSENATYFDGKRESSKFGHGMREFLPVCREFGKSY